MTKRKTFIVLIVILQLLTQLSSIDCRRPEAKKGKGKAFGAGILPGGLAGAALITKQNNRPEIHHDHYIIDPNAAPAASNAALSASTASPLPDPIPSTIIEGDETLANGCYKRFVKEPDVYDVPRFIKTELLVCPLNVPAPPSYIQQLPAEPVVPALEIQHLPMIPLPVPAVPSAVSENVILPAEKPSVHIASLVPLSPTLSETTQSHHGVAPIVPIIPEHLPQPVQPEISGIAPPLFPGSVFVLSQKT